MAQQTHSRRLFIGCIVALIATAFGFAVRGNLLSEWRVQFNLTQEQVGVIQGAGLYPFAISIILFSLVIDKLGYGVSMAVAFFLHLSSAVLTLCAPLALAGAGASEAEIASGQQTGYVLLYLGTFLYALGNGTVEAVINPVTATLFPDKKTHYLNILHAGWPGGLVLGGMLTLGFLFAAGEPEPNTVQMAGGSLYMWQLKMGIAVVPMLLYGVMLFGQKFPVQERVAAGVTYLDMLREFGWASCYIVCFLLVAGINQVLGVFGVPTAAPIWWAVIAIAPTVPFALYVKSFGRPMFVFLLLVMFLLATTELGTDSWIQDIMTSAMQSSVAGPLVFIYMAAIMFVLRFFAGPIVHKISPLGLLAVCAVAASAGLLWLSAVQTGFMIFLAATLYGVGKTFYWPTTLGVVSEQYPKGGALLLNAIAGVGMIAVGTLGNPAIGTIQDLDTRARLYDASPELADRVTTEKEGVFIDYQAVDPNLVRDLSAEDRAVLTQVESKSQQGALAKIAILPAVMFVCYLVLIFFFKSRGGYKAEVLVGHAANDEKFTGGTPGPGEG